MSIERRLIELKEDITTAKTESDKAEGVLSELQRQLKKEFGIKSFKDLPSSIASLEGDLREKEDKFEKAIEKVEERWPQ